MVTRFPRMRSQKTVLPAMGLGGPFGIATLPPPTRVDRGMLLKEDGDRPAKRE